MNESNNENGEPYLGSGIPEKIGEKRSQFCHGGSFRLFFKNYPLALQRIFNRLLLGRGID